METQHIEMSCGKNTSLMKNSGLEDIAFGKKAKTDGWGIFYCSEADVEHLHRENYKTISNRYREGSGSTQSN